MVVIRAIVENARVQDMFRRKVVLQAQEIVSGPLFVSVGVRRKLLHDAKGMLHALGIGKPKASPLDGAGKGKPRIPVSQVRAFLNVDPRSRVSRSETPAVIAIGSRKAKDAGAGVRIRGRNIAGLDFNGPRGIHVAACSQSSADRIAELKA